MHALPRVDAIYIADGADRPMQAVDEAAAQAGRGLAGDRYALGIGTYSRKPGPYRHLTLIAAEDLEALAADGWVLAPGEHRRNVVVRGVDLAAVEGREFRIGDVRLRSIRPCPPCGNLERVTGRPGLRAAFEGRSGIRVEILTDGTIRIGDGIHL